MKDIGIYLSVEILLTCECTLSCLFGHKGVQHLLCCVFALFLLLCLLAIVSLTFNLWFLITPMVPSNVPSLSLFALFLLLCLLAHCISVLQFTASDYPYGVFKCSLSKSVLTKHFHF